MIDVGRLSYDDAGYPTIRLVRELEREDLGSSDDGSAENCALMVVGLLDPTDDEDFELRSTDFSRHGVAQCYRRDSFDPARFELQTHEHLRTMAPRQPEGWSVKWNEGTTLDKVCSRLDLWNHNNARRKEEWNQLLVRLFHRYTNVEIVKVHDGRSLTSLLHIEADHGGEMDGKKESWVVKVGEYSAIKRERDGHRRLTRLLAGCYPTIREKEPFRRTVRLGGFVFSSIDSDTWTFGAYYTETNPREIGTSIRKLFQQNMSGCFQDTKPGSSNRSLEDYYAEFVFDRSALPKLRSLLTKDLHDCEISDNSIIFSPLEKELPNPLQILGQPSPQLLNEPLLLSPIHGRMEQRHMFVDKRGQIWLTDFSHATHGHRFQDFARLETSIKFELTQCPELDTWLQFEEKTLSDLLLDGSQPISDTSCEKVYHVISEIRATLQSLHPSEHVAVLAERRREMEIVLRPLQERGYQVQFSSLPSELLPGASREAALAEYLTSLLYNGLEMICWLPSTEARRRAWLSASLILDRLMTKDDERFEHTKGADTMDIPIIAQAAVAFLAPYLVKAGEEMAKQIGKGAVDAGRQLLKLIQSRLKGLPQETALDDLKNDPNEPDNQAALRKELKKIMLQDPKFKQELQQMVEQLEQDPDASKFLTNVYGDKNQVFNISQAGDLHFEIH
jgi:hypothetical protein